MKELIITENLELKSRYRIPHENARYWYWKDNKGNKGKLRAVQEMEALDRLDEFFPQRGAITWISRDNYNKI